MQQELTNVSCEIIAKVGTAKGLFVEAIELPRPASWIRPALC